MSNTFPGVTTEEIFGRIALKPTWKSSLFTVVSGIAFLTWLKSCWRGTSLAADLVVFGGAFIATFIVLTIMWLAMAAILYFSAAMCNPMKKVSFGNIFSLVSLCGVIFLIGEMLNFILVRSQLIPMSSYNLPGRFPIGMDLFLSGLSVSLPLAIALYSINPVTLCYGWAMSAGLKTVTGIRSGSAAVIVVALWCGIVGFAAFIASLMGGTTFGIRIG